jgi:BirA family biotin operon repressor/biotin-[acetyl-CoA-carboxylase] ligase
MTFSQARLVNELRESRDRWVQAGYLSSRLDVPPGHIKSALDRLVSSGYEIEAHPQLGYRLISEPAALLPEQLFPEHVTAGIPSEILVEDTVASTMDRIWDAASKPPRHGLVLFAEEQTAGRGRLGRRWIGTRGKSLLFSVAFHSRKGARAAHLLLTAASIAAAEAIRQATRLPVQIKWPNDLVVYEKKLGGLLLEHRPTVSSPAVVARATVAESAEAWVLGVGLNINHSATDFPPELAQSATSLRIELGSAVPRDALARELLASLGTWFEVFLNDDLALLEATWCKLSSSLGRRVRIEEGNKRHTGRVVGLSPTQGLVVQLSNGGLRTFRPERISIQPQAD